MKTRFLRSLLCVFVGSVLPIACNAITGIDRFSVDPAFSSSGSGGQAGAGGDAGAGGGGATGSECTTVLTCPGESNACQTPSCVAGVCQLEYEAAGTVVSGQTAGDCFRIECDGKGQTRTVVDKLDVPDDGLECTNDECSNEGVPSNTPKVEGATCKQGTGQVCNGSGQCVQCNFNANCNSGGQCVNGICVPPECNDTIKNGNESDIDCGGDQCAPCGTDHGCIATSDCASGVCLAGTCRAPTCTDNVANGDETDVDCGGPTCGDCADGKNCLVGVDCVSGVCTGNMCQVPACNDGVKNGSESDLDCGGSCPGCSVGKTCNASLDCKTEVCRNAKCTAVVQIDAGTGHACALLADGTVFCWGGNAGGQLGDGTTTDRPTATMVPGLSNVTQISTAAHVANFSLNGHTCARTSDGKLYCWGHNPNGQVGDGTIVDVVSPKEIVSADVVQVATGRLHTCARLTSGAVECWGNNSAGQLGTGNTASLMAPGPAIANLTAKNISTGYNHTCAVLATGELSCWGGNGQSQLGLGTTVNSSIPVTVPGSTNMIGVDTSYGFSCSLDMGGTVRCFGDNSSGQLGLGNIINQTTPQVITTLSGVVGISTGPFTNIGGHGCAVKSNGGAACWGNNSMGQLGVGDINNRLSPQSVSLPPVAEIAAGLQFTCARLLNGPIRCWGRNDVSQLGTGKATTMETTPVAVVFP